MKNLIIGLVFCICAVIMAFTIITMAKPDDKPIPIRQAIKTVKVPEFHVKVKHWKDCYWSATFTNDNFDSEFEFMNAFDISGGYVGNCVCYQLKLFNSETEAVRFARRFITLEQCVQYNEKAENEYKQLKEFRDANPVQKKELSESGNCTSDEGKEILIY